MSFRLTTINQNHCATALDTETTYAFSLRLPSLGPHRQYRYIKLGTRDRLAHGKYDIDDRTNMPLRSVDTPFPISMSTNENSSYSRVGGNEYLVSNRSITGQGALYKERHPRYQCCCCSNRRHFMSDPPGSQDTERPISNISFEIRISKADNDKSAHLRTFFSPPERKPAHQV